VPEAGDLSPPVPLPLLREQLLINSIPTSSLVYCYLVISQTSPRATRPAVNQSRTSTFPFAVSSKSCKEQILIVFFV